MLMHLCTHSRMHARKHTRARARAQQVWCSSAVCAPLVRAELRGQRAVVAKQRPPVAKQKTENPKNNALHGSMGSFTRKVPLLTLLFESYSLNGTKSGGLLSASPDLGGDSTKSRKHMFQNAVTVQASGTSFDWSWGELHRGWPLPQLFFRPLRPIGPPVQLET